MNTIPKTTIIIPAYNESDRPVSVLENALHAHHISSIIIVDDGSSDDTAHHITTFLTKKGNALAKDNDIDLIFLQHATNSGGKTEAIKSMLSYVRTPTILMLDADIKGFLPEYIDAMVEQFHYQDASMLIYHKESSGQLLLKVMDTIIGSELLYTGERMLKTAILQTVLATGTRGYLLETSLNIHCLDNNEKIVLLKGPYFHHILKAEKGGGTIRGIWGDIRMGTQIIKRGGLGSYVRQRKVFSSLLAEAPSINPKN